MVKEVVDPETGEVKEETHYLDEEGREFCGGPPITDIPLRLRRVMNLTSEVQRVVKDELSRLRAAEGYETFEEADDFDCGDDDELRSPYELDDEVIYDGGPNSDNRRVDGSPGPSGGGGEQVDEEVRGGGEDAEESAEGVGGRERPAGKTIARQPAKPGKEVKG